MRKLLLFVWVVLVISAKAETRAQPLSVSYKGTAVAHILADLKRQTGLKFFYEEELIARCGKMDVELHNKSIKEILDAVLTPNHLEYRIIGGTVNIVAARQVASSKEPAKHQRAISGVVRDDSGAPLEGDSVSVKGAGNIGTTTGKDGRFVLEIPSSDAVLIVSYLGFVSQEVSTSGSQPLSIALQPDKSDLQEVVVVGYGTMQKKDLTGAIASVQGEDIAVRKATQVSSALQGAVPGLMVTRGSGAPGATASIRVRGITTIDDAGSNPLIILDGVPIDDINSVNPNDIDNISVLKDAASASIYGSRAASGVILVTTKRAKAGESGIDYSFEQGWETPTQMPEYVDAVRFMQLVNELRWNDNGNNDNEYPTYTKDVVDDYLTLNQENPDDYPITDWKSLIMKDFAPRQSHTLSVYGSGDNIRSRASIAYDKVDALYDYRSYERVTSRINTDATIGKRITASVDINFKRTIDKRPITESLDEGSALTLNKMAIVPPIYAAMWSDGRIGAGKDGANIYARLMHGGFIDSWYNQIGGKVSLDYKPLEGLKLSGIFSPFLNMDKRKTFNKQIPYTTWSTPDQVAGYIEGANNTKLSENRNDDYRYTVQFLANYDKTFGDHQLGLLAGYEYFKAFNEELGASRDQYDLDNYPYLDLGPLAFRDNSGKAYENAYRSWFGRVSYNYKGRYLLQGNLRYDGSSRFAPGYRWGAFPSVSAGWVLTEEPFFNVSNNILSFLKIRGSWGSLGNERIKGNYPYQAILRFENNSLFYRGNEIVSAQSAAQWQYAIRDISWETTHSYDIGLDANLLDSRLSVVFDYYRKTTKDILLELEIPDFVGFDNPFQNTGEMYTRGWEAQVGWRERFDNWRYSASVNVSDFRSIMGDLGGTEFLGDKIKIQGSEFNEWYGYVSEGLYQTQAEVDGSAVLNANVGVGDVRYRDVSGPEGVPDGKISPEYDRVFLGGSLPRYLFGANLNVGYRNWDLGLVIQGVGKWNSRLSQNIVRPLRENYGNFPAILDGNSWSYYNSEEQNRTARYPRYTNTSAGNNYAMSDFWLINGGYVRLKNVSLGYNLPAAWLERVKLAGFRLYATVNDAFVIHDFPTGWDPENASAAHPSLYPMTTTYLIGASVRF